MSRGARKKLQPVQRSSNEDKSPAGPPPRKRRTYESPRLREYGPLARLVRGIKAGKTPEGPTTKAGVG